MNAPKPGTPEWARLVTASKVAAILGVSPWESQRSMWHTMRGELPIAPESRPMRRGNMLENAVLDWWLADNPEWVEVERQPVFTIDDWCLATPDMLVEHRDTGERMLVDAKTTSSDMDWADDVPVYYVASSMWQLAMAPNVERVCLAALFGKPFDMRSFYVDRDDELIDGIVSKCRAFYDSLTQDTPPALSDHVADYAATVRTVTGISAGDTAELADDVAAGYLQALAYEKAADIFKARVLDAMGEAQYATHNGQKIARRQKKGDGVSLVRIAPLPNVIDTIPESEVA